MFSQQFQRLLILSVLGDTKKLAILKVSPIPSSTGALSLVDSRFLDVSWFLICKRQLHQVLTNGSLSLEYHYYSH